MTRPQKVILTIAVVFYVSLFTLTIGGYYSSPHSLSDVARINGCNRILQDGNCKIVDSYTGKTMIVRPQEMPAYGLGSSTSSVFGYGVLLAFLGGLTIFTLVLFTPLFLIWGSKHK